MHAYQHEAARPLIPSKEEAGMESQSEAARKQQSGIPLNSAVARTPSQPRRGGRLQ